MKHELLGAEAFSAFLADKTNKDKVDALASYLYMDVVARSQENHPDYDVDRISEMALDYVGEFVQHKELKCWEFTYGRVVSFVKQKVENKYVNLVKTLPVITTIDSARNIADNSFMVEEIGIKLSKQDLCKVLQNNCTWLTDRDKLILKMRYIGNGTDDKGMSYSEIANELHLTKSRVCEIINRIMKKLKTITRKKVIREKANSLTDLF